MKCKLKKQSNSYALNFKYFQCVLDHRLVEIILLYIFCHCQNAGSLKIKILENSGNFATPQLVSPSEEQVKKFHTDDVSLPNCG